MFRCQVSIPVYEKTKVRGFLGEKKSSSPNTWAHNKEGKRTHYFYLFISNLFQNVINKSLKC